MARRFLYVGAILLLAVLAAPGCGSGTTTKGTVRTLPPDPADNAVPKPGGIKSG
jgi:hypothetical protein